MPVFTAKLFWWKTISMHICYMCYTNLIGIHDLHDKAGVGQQNIILLTCKMMYQIIYVLYIIEKATV